MQGEAGQDLAQAAQGFRWNALLPRPLIAPSSPCNLIDMVEHEGLVMGGSTGVNVAGAIRLARDLGPGHTIVTILCDQGARYQSKIFNPAFLAEKGLPAPPWL